MIINCVKSCHIWIIVIYLYITKQKQRDMETFLKQNLKKGKKIIFDNELTFTDNFLCMECTFKSDLLNSWANGFKITFNGKVFSFKTFGAFFKKFNQLKEDFNLQLKAF